MFSGRFTINTKCSLFIKKKCHYHFILAKRQTVALALNKKTTFNWIKPRKKENIAPIENSCQNWPQNKFNVVFGTLKGHHGIVSIWFNWKKILPLDWMDKIIFVVLPSNTATRTSARRVSFLSLSEQAFKHCSCTQTRVYIYIYKKV